jgi:hypothetical protein
MKACVCCKKEKMLDSFYLHKSPFGQKKETFSSRCKSCLSEGAKVKYREEMKIKMKKKWEALYQKEVV